MGTFWVSRIEGDGEWRVATTKRTLNYSGHICYVNCDRGHKSRGLPPRMAGAALPTKAQKTKTPKDDDVEWTSSASAKIKNESHALGGAAEKEPGKGSEQSRAGTCSGIFQLLLACGQDPGPINKQAPWSWRFLREATP